MSSERAHRTPDSTSIAETSTTPLELRIAFAGLLLFAALLPVQVMLRVPGLAGAAAVSPADLPLALSVVAYLVGLLRRTARLRLGSFGIAVGLYLLCVAVSVATSEALGRSIVRSANVL